MEYASMTSQIFQFDDYQNRDIQHRMADLYRETLHVYEAAVVLAISAVELQMVMLGMMEKE